MMKHVSIVVPALLALSATASLAAVDGAATLAPPKGSALIARYAASGTQIYTCTAKDGQLLWSAAVPDADLKSADGTFIAHHSKGPTWQARDGSKVTGALVAKANAPKSGAVPWLLLTATSSGSGPLAHTKYVMRLDTTGGVEPSRRCTIAGETSKIPYMATYAFFQ